jgi:KDO2-lipid IV(A) lauroyltransferase
MNVGVTFFEALAIEKIRKKSTKWITLRNATVVREMMEEGRGLIMIFAHVGNWELFSIIYERLGIRGIAVESPNDGKKVRELLLSIRKSSNIKMVPRGDKSSARSILTCFRNNEVFLFAMDQDTKVRSIFVDFFGRKASTAVGAATFAQKFDAPVVAAFGARAEDGSHVYTFELLSRSPYTGGEEEAVRLTESYNRAIEAHIRKYPDQWVWFHRRWKNRPDDSDEGERAEEGV